MAAGSSSANPFANWGLAMSDASSDSEECPAMLEAEVAAVAAEAEEGLPPALRRGEPVNVGPETVAALQSSHSTLWNDAVLVDPFKRVLDILAAKDVAQSGHPDVDKVASFYLHSPTAMHLNKSVLSKLLGMAKDNITPALTALASGLLHSDWVARWQLERAIADTGHELLLFLELSRYDETPMRVRHTQALDPLATKEGGHPNVPEAAGATASGSSHYGGRFFSQGSPIAKLFATETHYGMLLKLQHPATVDSGADTQYVYFSGSALTCLQVVDSTAGSTLAQALTANASLSQASQRFRMKVRVATTDEHGGNLGAEKLVGNLLGDTWATLHHPCNVHCVARSFEKTFDLISTHIQGLIHFSLSLSVGSSMAKFRSCLAAIITERLSIRIGYPSAEMEAYRVAMLELFCQTGAHASLKQHLLQRLPNGDWRQSQQIQVFVPPGQDYDEGRLRQDLVTTLLICLSGKLFRVYPRHRWVGCDIVTDEIGLLECVHKLASTTFLRMVGASEDTVHDRLSGEDRTDDVDTQANAPAVLADPILTSTVGGEEPDHLEEQGLEEFRRLAASSYVETPGASEDSWSAINDRHRKIAALWMRSQPLAYLMAMRQCMRPLCDLLLAYITRSGHKWEKKQRDAHIETLLAGEGAARAYPLQESLQLVSENTFFRSLQQLRNPEPWQHIPRSSCTLSFQGVCFRMLSRMGCAVHQLLVFSTKQCPWSLFRSLWEGPETLEQVYHSPECRQDSFTKGFCKQFPLKEDLSIDADGRACLQAMLQSISTETVGIEWGHGRVHRLIQAGSVQAVTPSLEFIAAQWLCQKHHQRISRTGLHNTEKHTKVGEDPEAEAASDDPAPKRRKTGGGGTWRAYISLTTRGQKTSPDLKELGQRFQRDRAEQTQIYLQAQELGAAATRRHQEAGALSFGPKTRQYLRKRQTAVNIANSLRDVLDLRKQPHQQALQATAAKDLSLMTNLPGEMTMVRRADLARRREERMREAARLPHILKYTQQRQAAMLAELVEACPSLVPNLDALHYSPSVDLLCVDLVPDLAKKATNIAGWALTHSRTSNLASALSADWSQRHRAIPEPQTEQTSKKSRGLSCMDFGMCVCQSREGRKALTVRNKFLKFLKQECRSKDSKERGLLQQGMVVVRLQEEPKPDTSNPWTGWCGGLNTPEEVSTDTLVLKGSVWLHLGMHYFKPYRPSFQVLDFVCEDAHRRCTLSQTGHFLTESELWGTLDLTSKWRCSFFIMVETSAPVAVLQPRLCIVQAGKQTDLQIWPPPRQPRARVPRRGSISRGSSAFAGPAAAASQREAASSDTLPDEDREERPGSSEDEPLGRGAGRSHRGGQSKRD